MNILVINGPNLNNLGKRDRKHYGAATLDAINARLGEIGKKHNISLMFFQSNHEGAIVDFIQEHAEKASGILINPGALTHYGYSLRDALADTRLPIVEVHLSNINRREDFRKVDVLKDVAIKVVMGLKEKSYYRGLELLIEYIRKSRLSHPER